jgi:hypothetical protein
MRYFGVLVAFLASVGLFAQQAASPPTMNPMANRLEPKVAKPGSVVTITGVALGKSRVEEVFLTDHRFDLKVKVLEQTDQSLTIRVPPFVKAGRQQLLLLTSGQNAAYLEQPVYLLIELDEDVAKTDAPKPSAAPAAGDKANNNDKPDRF